MRPGLRWATAAAALALFVAGSNFCVIAALAGQSMACLTAPGAAPSTSSHCAGHPAGDSGGPAAPTTSPCCLTLAPVAKVDVAKVETSSSVVADLAGDLGCPSCPMVSSHTSALNESPPGSSDPPGPCRGRAPPLL